MSSSFSRTGRTFVNPGEYFVLAGRNIVARMTLTKRIEVRMGVHPVTKETVYHPLDRSGHSELGITFFGEYFDPQKYAQFTVLEHAPELPFLALYGLVHERSS